MLWFYLIFELLALSLICNVETARILAVLPTPSMSHQVVFRPLMRELARRGHEVVVITTDPAYPKGATPRNLTEIDLHNVSYVIWRQQILNKKEAFGEGKYKQFKNVIKTFSIIFSKQMENYEVKKLLQDKENAFDLLFIEACSRSALSFSHLYKVPVILISSFGTTLENEETIGAPSYPIIYPSTLRQRIYNLTMWETLSELYAHYLLSSFYSNFEEKENQMLRRRFGVDFPSLSELKNNVDMLFLNVNPLWQGNPPVPPSVMYMGGMHLKPKKGLPQYLKSFLDSSKDGVIYISFGTNVQPSMMLMETTHICVSVLSQLPYDVLWKWDKDELPGRSENIRISKWFPQADILNFYLLLIINLGKLERVEQPQLVAESIEIEKYVQLKIGIRLDVDIITEKSFMEAIKTTINDESYQRNVVKLRDLMNDQIEAPLQRAVWWTEYVLRHGSSRHLRSPAANITWFEYLEIELVSIVILIFFLLFVVSVKAVSLLLTFIKDSKNIS